MGLCAVPQDAPPAAVSDGGRVSALPWPVRVGPHQDAGAVTPAGQGVG